MPSIFGRGRVLLSRRLPVRVQSYIDELSREKMPQTRWDKFGVAVLLSAMSLALLFYFDDVLSTAPYVFFIGAIFISSVYGGLAPGITALAILALAYLYYFVEPELAITGKRFTPGDAFGFTAFIGVSIAVVLLVAMFRVARRRLERSGLEAKHLAALVKSSPDAIFSKDLAGIVTSWNQAAEQLYGFSAKEMIGQPIMKIIPEDRQSEFFEVMAKLRSGEPIHRQETVRVHKSGRRIEIDLRLAPVADARGRIVEVTGIAHDITERKRQEKMLQRTTEQLRVIFQNVADGLTVQDPDGKVIFANQVVAEMSGFKSADEMMAASPRQMLERFEMIGEDGSPIEPDRLPGRRVLAGEAAVDSLVGYRLRGNPETRWSLVKARPVYNDQGKLDLVVNIMSDVTRQRQAEEALRSSEQHFRVLSEAIPQVVWTARPDGYIEYFNQQWYDYSGLTIGESLGWTWEEAIHPYDRQTTVDHWNRALEAGSEFEIENRVRGKDGRYRWFLVRAIPVKDDQGRITKWFGTSTDIHDRKEAERALAFSEYRFRTMIEESPMSMQIFDPDGSTKKVNPAWAELWQSEIDEVAGYNVLQDPQVEEAGIKPLIERAFQGEATEIPPTYYDPNKIGKKGRPRWLKGFFYPVKDGEDNLREVVLVHQDVTLEMENERMQKFMSEVSDILSSSLDQRTVLSALARHTVPTLGDICAIDYLEKGKLERVALATTDSELTSALLEAFKEGRFDGSSGSRKVVRTGEPLFYPEITDELLEGMNTDPGYQELIKSLGLRSVIVVPIEVQGAVMGAITTAVSVSNRRYDHADLHRMRNLAEKTSMALENTLLFKELKDVAAQSQELSQQLEAILENVADGITVQRPDGAMVYANPVIARMAGFSDIKEYMSQSSDQIFAKFIVRDEDGDIIQRDNLPGHEVIKTRAPAETTYCYESKDSGKQIWANVKVRPVFSDAGELILLVNLFQDITARKEQEQALASRARQQAILADIAKTALAGADWQELIETISPLAVDALGVDYGRVLELLPNKNELLLRAGFGWREGLVGHTTVETKNPDNTCTMVGYLLQNEEPIVILEDARSEERFEIAPALREHGVVSGMSVVIRTSQGPYGVICVHSKKRRLFSKDDVNFILTVANILAASIERQHIEQQKDEFISVASHELKTPVTSMKVFAQSQLRAARRQGAPAEAIEGWEGILRQVDKMAQLVGKVLDVSRIELGKLVMNTNRIEIKDLIQETIGRLDEVIDTHQLVFRGSDVKMQIEADPDRLEQVLVNLISNAIQHSQLGQTVTITLEQQDSRVIIGVEDQGPGIPADKQGHLFDRFYQVDPDRSAGVGLGLYISKQIVLAHGGEIWVESEAGRGSTFYFSLPLHPSARYPNLLMRASRALKKELGRE